MPTIQKESIFCSLADTAHTARICRALSNETRLEILRILTERSLTISELAAEFMLPMSSMCLHIRTLQDAGLILITEAPGTHGIRKICSTSAQSATIDFFAHQDISAGASVAYEEMPVGHYSSCQVMPPCGLASQDSYLHYEDSPYGFYSANHVNASLIWFYSGYLEYQFSNHLLHDRKVKQVEFSFEICAEAPGYNNQWPSDVILEINHQPIASLFIRGDYGGRRGIYNPDWWSDGNTQFGEHKKIVLTQDGCYLGETRVSHHTLNSLHMAEGFFFYFTLKVDENSTHVGGLNLFGKYFGDYSQDIMMKVVYE